jgi:hypothetical protein
MQCTTNTEDRMKKGLKLLSKIVSVVLVAALAIAPIAAPPAQAAAPNLPGIGASLIVLPFHISGQYTASKTALVKLNMPFPARVLYVHASINAKGGTQGTTTLQCLNAGTGVTNAMDLGTPAAGTIVEATLTAAQQNVAKDAAFTCDLVMTGGSSPTINDVTLIVVLGRR